MQWTPKWNWWRDQSKLCFPSYSWNPLTSIVSWLCQNYSIYLPFHFVKCISISLLSKTLLGTFLLKSSFPITCSLSLLPCPRFKVTFLACLSSFRGPPHTAETVGAYKLQWKSRLPTQVMDKPEKWVWTEIMWYLFYDISYSANVNISNDVHSDPPAGCQHLAHFRPQNIVWIQNFCRYDTPVFCEICKREIGAFLSVIARHNITASQRYKRATPTNIFSAIHKQTSKKIFFFQYKKADKNWRASKVNT